MRKTVVTTRSCLFATICAVLNPIIQTKTFRAAVAFIAILIFLLVLFLTDASQDAFMENGGNAGFISSALVMLGFYLQGKKAENYETLFWRALCDMGVALRFMLNSQYNQLLCGASTCSRTTVMGNNEESNCFIPSAHLQFFVCASEAWFLCNGLDLYFTVNNPFSTIKSRIWKYHLFVWGISAFVTVFPWISVQANTVYGLWYIDNDINGASICWLRIQAQDSLGYPIWVVFFLPLVLVYLFCGAMMVSVYYRLRKGLSQSFLPRVRLLVAAATMIAGLFLYWITALILYAIVYCIRNYVHESKLVFKFLLFVFSSKGFSSLVIWINLRGDYQYFSSATDAEQRESVSALLDANEALRVEVLSIATAGIRSTACLAVTPEMEAFTRRSYFRSRQLQPSSGVGSSSATAGNESESSTKPQQPVLTPLLFLKFAMGFDTKHSVSLISNSLRTVNTVDEDEFLPTEQSVSSNVRPSMLLDEDDNLIRASNIMRLSHRPTIASNSSNGPQSAGSNSNGRISNSFLVNREGTTTTTTLKRSSGTNAGVIGKSRTSLAMIPEHKKDTLAADTTGRVESSESDSSWTGSPLAPPTAAVTSTVPGVGRPSQAKRGSDGLQMRPTITFSDFGYYHGRTSTYDRLRTAMKPVTDYFENDLVEFEEVMPYYYREVRKAFGIKDEFYAEEFSKTVKQRLTEGGASGAFFFFSKTDQFVAKSCTLEELEVLRNNAHVYSDYMINNPNTFICKVFGVYRLTIYNTQLHFFVMNNLFLNAEGLTMNEKYDIKGSWVARNSTPPQEGQVFSCSFCERKFIYRKKRRTYNAHHSSSITSTNSRYLSASMDSIGERQAMSLTEMRHIPRHIQQQQQQQQQPPNDDSTGSNHSSASFINSNHNPMIDTAFIPATAVVGGRGSSTPSSVPAMNPSEASTGPSSSFDDKCPVTVGEHFPNVILKDNDIKHKIRLSEAESLAVQVQLKKDADFLSSLYIMDYSLLIGVHNTEYEVTDSISSPSNANNGSNSPMGGGRMKSIQRFSKRSNPNMLNPTANTVATDATNGSLVEGDVPISISTTTAAASNNEMGVGIAMTRKLDVHRIIGPDAYFMGIIDFQQTWTIWKRLERFFKINFKQADPEGLSAIDPYRYKERFLRKVEDILDHEGYTRPARLFPSASMSMSGSGEQLASMVVMDGGEVKE